MPEASPASLAALTSEISTEHTVVTIDIKFKKQGQSAADNNDADDTLQNLFSAHTSSYDGAAGISTAGLVGWWHASDLTGPVGGNISTWGNRVPGAPMATFPGNGSCANAGKGVPPVLSKAGAVFENHGYLCATLPAAGPKTFVAAFTASGPQSTDWGCLLCGRGPTGQDAGVSPVKCIPD